MSERTQNQQLIEPVLNERAQTIRAQKSADVTTLNNIIFIFNFIFHYIIYVLSFLDPFMRFFKVRIFNLWKLLIIFRIEIIFFT